MPCGEDQRGWRMSRQRGGWANRVGALAAVRGRESGVLDGDDFGEDGDSDFRGAAAAKIEADWTVDTRQVLIIHAPVSQGCVPFCLSGVGSQQADVADGAPQAGLQGRDVELGVVGEDDEGVLGTEGLRREGILRPSDDELVDVGEALPRGKGTSGVYEADVETKHLRHSRQGHGDVDGPDDGEGSRAAEDLEEHVGVRTSLEFCRGRGRRLGGDEGQKSGREGWVTLHAPIGPCEQVARAVEAGGKTDGLLTVQGVDQAAVCLDQGLDVDPNGTATGETDLPTPFIDGVVLEAAGFPALEDILSLAEDVALHTPTADGPRHVARGGDGHT